MVPWSDWCSTCFAAMLAVASLPAYTPRPNLNPYLSVPPRERAGAISPPDVNQTEHLKLARLEECDDVQPPHGWKVTTCEGLLDMLHASKPYGRSLHRNTPIVAPSR